MVYDLPDQDHQRSESTAMFISVLDLFKIGIGPSSSHTMGPMVAAGDFRQRCLQYTSDDRKRAGLRVHCTLTGSLACTGKGHASDQALLLGLHGYQPAALVHLDIATLVQKLAPLHELTLENAATLRFDPDSDIVFDRNRILTQHPNGMIFQLLDAEGNVALSQTYFSIGGGFINTLDEIQNLAAPLRMHKLDDCPYGFDSAAAMLDMAARSGLSIAAMKQQNELQRLDEHTLDTGLDAIWQAMQQCLETGLATSGVLPGGLNLARRARHLYQQLQADPDRANVTEWLCAYAMAVNEENAAGHMVVTAPTNGAAGVIPAVLYYQYHHLHATPTQVRDFLLTAAAVGGIIKHRSSISGAEVGCQGEVGSAAAMAAAGLCAVWGGDAAQVENAAEIALEHHLGMTCDPVNGLVQVPCIERNGFGAVKAYAAASLAIRGDGRHFMPLDNCIAAMKQTGQEMSVKFKETSLGGLAVSITEC